MYEKLLAKNLLCTGCGACVNKCANNAIDFVYDNGKDGSLIAKINEEKCTFCHACEEVCPVMTEHVNTNRKADDCFAVWADDIIRMQSSSGGAFTVLAENVLCRGGYICAVAYGDEFKAEHVLISDKDELYKLRRSKYVQSDVGFIYRKIKELLCLDKEILFVGTPCQVAGLKAFLGKDYKRLLLVDIYCNYTPSYPLFRKYLYENYDVGEIRKIDFRVKNYGWIADIHTITKQNGTVEEKREYNDSFQMGYHPKLFMRETCEKCVFAGNPRQGDLSIADFWHIGEFCPELDDSKGTSCVVVNNEKGASFFETLKSNFIMCRKVPIEWMKYNRGAITEPHPARNRFYELLKTRSFNEAVDFALNDKYDIVVWGNWSEKNYGSELTYYALYEILSELNYDVLMVERPQNAVWGPNPTPVLFKESPYKELAVHKLYPDKVSMYELNEKSDIFIVGSDQIWHRNLYNDFGKVAFLDYIYNDKKKIAYASSFGRDYWSGNSYETQEVAYYLKDFDYISLREKSGVSICRKYFNVVAQSVLDPVFLCPKKKYENLAQKSNQKREQSYIGGYILDISPCKLRILKRVQELMKIPCTILTDAFRKTLIDQETITIQENAFCEDWLCNIINSKFVITDSFHGMCFAIIFNKPFIAISNETRGKVRFTDLLDELKLSDRLISEADTMEKINELITKPIDYLKVNEILKEKRVYSIHWLKNALNEPKEHRLREYDILHRKIQESEKQVGFIQRKMPYIEHELGNRKWDISVHRKELNENRASLLESKEEIERIKQRQDELAQQIENLNSYWILRVWRKISKWIHK